MNRSHNNPRHMLWLAPFNGLTLSSAYIVPFFIEHGLTMTEILTLQSVFSIAGVLWEIPSGYLADRFGRALCIKVSVPLAAIGLLFYGISGHFWQFVLCEIILALARGLVSGVQTALLIDSLAANDRSADFRHYAQRIKAIEYASVAVGVPVAFTLVRYLGVSATIVGDGLLAAMGAMFAFRLSEAPKPVPALGVMQVSVWQSAKLLAVKPQVWQLMLLGTSLSAATYFGFWFSAPYYATLGIPVGVYGLLFALRNAFKAWLAHRYAHRHLERLMVTHAGIVLMVALCMALGQPWLVWVVLGHDVVQALGEQPITEQLNGYISEHHRATLNSVVVVIRRLSYSIVGPIVGLTVDRWGVASGMLGVGVVCSMLALWMLVCLRRSGVFVKSRVTG